jgi:cellulose synthase operon protein C
VIVHFPNLDVLRLALTSGVIPEEARSTSARFGFAEDRSLWVAPAAPLDGATEKELRRLGVRLPRNCAIELPLQADHWLQMFPLTRDPGPVEVGDKTPVLFELATTTQLAELASEMLRLGNDRQSFRWLGAGMHDKALLRVVGPPYYSLLRALESEDAALTAYREVAPRVWVQLGWSHPLAEHLRPPAGQWLFLRPPHRWQALPEATLRDICEVIDFQLPDRPAFWHDHELPARLQVPVKLTRGGVLEAAELWVLRETGIVQLEGLVHSAGDDLLARLAFAVGAKDGERIVVLRARPSKNPPPVLVLEGSGFRPYLRIPNLFLPVGQTLHPPLRRDAVIKLLADDKSQITWLWPKVDGGFTPESLPDEAFRPLPAWIDYVLEHDRYAIAQWLGANQFQFEGFICKDDAPKPKKPPAPKQTRKLDAKNREEVAPTKQDIETTPRSPPTATEQPISTQPVEPGALEKRLRALEDRFTALATPLDDPPRRELWREMAQLNGSLGRHGDAATCWSNAFWEAVAPPTDWAESWFLAEAKQPASAALLERLVKQETPTHATLRLLAAALIGAAANPTLAAALRPILAKAQRYFEQHEGYLGTRIVWLTWYAIHQLAGGDLLALARARDRLLERLFLHGLTPELDQPAFLRYSGLQASNRFRLVRDQVVRLRQLVQDWAKLGPNPTPATHAYIDLVFSFGLARLGEAGEARNLLAHAADSLAHADEVHSWLYEAYAFRIQQALDAKPGLERLPAPLLQRLDAVEHPDFLQHLDPAGRDKMKQQLRLQRLRIERLRTASRIIEPVERLYAYRHWHRLGDDELTRELTALTDLHDHAELIDRLEKLLGGKRKLKGASKADPRILMAALELAPRLGLAFAEQILDRVPAQLAKLTEAPQSAELLEKALFLAAHCDRKDDVQRFVGQLHELLQNARSLPTEKLIPLFAGSVRSLRKFGLRDAVFRLMSRLEAIVAADPALRPSAKPALAGNQLGNRHCLLLELAAGWLYFGAEAKARAILDDARGVLFRKELYFLHQAELACAYLTALGQAPLEFALSRVMEFFRKVEGIYDNYTTLSHYSLTRLNVVEAMMLALCSDDFTLDREARQRLDDDEYLVRRRIHRDVREALAGGAG